LGPYEQVKTLANENHRNLWIVKFVEQEQILGLDLIKLGLPFRRFAEINQIKQL
jgi:hypothetical protein